MIKKHYRHELAPQAERVVPKHLPPGMLVYETVGWVKEDREYALGGIVVGVLTPSVYSLPITYVVLWP